MNEEIVKLAPNFSISISETEQGLKGIRLFQAKIRQLMVVGVDYGVIPGTNKASLWKPGAEKLVKLLKLADTYEFMDCQQNYDKPFFAYTIKCQLKMYGTEVIISEGIGNCNSNESKYKYRWVYENDLPAGVPKETFVKKEFKSKTGGKWTKYRVDNDDLCSQANTIMKMAKKRALVDAALSAGRLSEIFTQDIGDDELVEGMDIPVEQKLGVEGCNERLEKKEKAPPKEKIDPDFEKKRKANLEKLGIKTDVKPAIVKDYCPYCKCLVSLIPDHQESNLNKETKMMECNTCGNELVERP
jgi:hypothetical protein